MLMSSCWNTQLHLWKTSCHPHPNNDQSVIVLSLLIKHSRGKLWSLTSINTVLSFESFAPLCEYIHTSSNIWHFCEAQIPTTFQGGLHSEGIYQKHCREGRIRMYGSILETNLVDVAFGNQILVFHQFCNDIISLAYHVPSLLPPRTGMLLSSPFFGHHTHFLKDNLKYVFFHIVSWSFCPGAEL